MKHVLLVLLVACGDNAATEPGPDATPGDAPPLVEPPAPRLELFPYLIAVDVSPDGTLAAFEDATIEGITVHVFDTVSHADRFTVDGGDAARNLVTGIADTGALSALHGEPVQAGLWTEATDWTQLGSPHAAGCDQDISGAFDVSGDGSTVVGLAWNGCTASAFRWSGAFTPLEVLGTPFEGSPNPPANRATVISDDGKVAAGFAQQGNIDRVPAAWRADGTGFVLDPDNREEAGEVLAIDADGHTLAGNLGNDGFVWTPGTGIVRLGRTPNALPSDPVFPNAISGDGSLVFGGVGSAFFGIPEAFVWSFDAGTRPLAELVTDAGLAIPEGTALTSVLGASADGTVLAGTAMDIDGAPLTFVVRLPKAVFAAP